jgi:hypothetical protein
MKESTITASAVVGLCVYETVAITSRRIPTVSKLCRSHRAVEAVLLAILLAHLHYKIDRAIEEVNR